MANALLGGGSSPFAHPESRMERFKRLIGSLPEIRIERIDALRPAILGKTYQVSTELLARRLVNEAASDAIYRGRLGLERLPYAI